MENLKQGDEVEGLKWEVFRSKEDAKNAINRLCKSCEKERETR